MQATEAHWDERAVDTGSKTVESGCKDVLGTGEMGPEMGWTDQIHRRWPTSRCSPSTASGTPIP